MATLYKDKRGLSQVVTTLILLMVSVLLAGVVTYLATNIVMTRTQQEEVRLTKQHIWVNSTGAVGAFMLQNLGGKDVLMDKIEVRGVTSSWSNVYYCRIPSGTTITADLNVTSYDRLMGLNATIDGRTYSQASDDIPVTSGEVLLFYIKGPDNINLDDVGTTVSVAAYTINGPYIVECNVGSANR